MWGGHRAGDRKLANQAITLVLVKIVNSGCKTEGGWSKSDSPRTTRKFFHCGYAELLIQAHSTTQFMRAETQLVVLVVAVVAVVAVVTVAWRW
jgi:hypothetical protein